MSKNSLALDGMHPEVIQSLKELGMRIRANRIAQAWTIKQMSERLFCSQNTYRAIEAGKPTASIGILVSALWLLGEMDTLQLVAPIPMGAVRAQRVRNPKQIIGQGLITEAERDF
jgi:DNA-binding XRE family transcriptional regulator